MPPNLLPLFMAARLGDTQALTDLLTLMVDPLRHFAFSVHRNRDDAEDVVQETLLALVRAARNTCRQYSFDENEDAFLAFIFKIVRNQIVRAQRQQGRFPQSDDPTGDRLRNLFDPTDPSEDCQAILEVVETLPLVDQELFRLIVEEQCKSAEIGEILDGVNESTIRWRWSRTKDRLLQALERHHPELVIKYRLRG